MLPWKSNKDKNEHLANDADEFARKVSGFVLGEVKRHHHHPPEEMSAIILAALSLVYSIHVALLVPEDQEQNLRALPDRISGFVANIEAIRGKILSK
jgi:hypothetical protein